MSETDFYIAGLTFAGIIIIYVNNKRRFDRLNQFGMERHPSFRRMIGTKLIDGVLYSASFVFMVTAAITFFIEHAQSTPLLSVTFALFIICLIFNSKRDSRH